jgi:hypothetical protein
MANAATITVTATILPYDIALIIRDISATYTPADASEGWYYKLTNITNASTDLIEALPFLQKGSTSVGIDAGSATSTVATADKVKFLFIKHLSLEEDGTTANTADSIYVCFDAGAAAHNLPDAIEIGPGECWYGKLSGATVADIHAISARKSGATTSSNKIQCLVAAIIDDVA